MIHKFIIELTDDVKGYKEEVDYLERVYGAEELTGVPIIHGKAELELHDKAIRNKTIDDFAETLIPRLTDAIYSKDVEGMRNLINDVAEQLKEGGEDAGSI